MRASPTRFAKTPDTLTWTPPGCPAGDFRVPKTQRRVFGGDSLRHLTQREVEEIWAAAKGVFRFADNLSRWTVVIFANSAGWLFVTVPFSSSDFHWAVEEAEEIAAKIEGGFDQRLWNGRGPFMVNVERHSTKEGSAEVTIPLYINLDDVAGYFTSGTTNVDPVSGRRV